MTTGATRLISSSLGGRRLRRSKQPLCRLRTCQLQPSAAIDHQRTLPASHTAHLALDQCGRARLGNRWSGHGAKRHTALVHQCHQHQHRRHHDGSRLLRQLHRRMRIFEARRLGSEPHRRRLQHHVLHQRAHNQLRWRHWLRQHALRLDAWPWPAQPRSVVRQAHGL